MKNMKPNKKNERTNIYDRNWNSAFKTSLHLKPSAKENR